jgi:hypothetical protein
MLPETIVEISGQPPALILLRDDEAAEQPRAGRFGLRAIRDLRRQQRPRFSELPLCLCRRRVFVVVRFKTSDGRCSAQRMGRHAIPEHARLVANREDGGTGVSRASISMVQLSGASDAPVPCRFL